MDDLGANGSQYDPDSEVPASNIPKSIKENIGKKLKQIRNFFGYGKRGAEWADILKISNRSDLSKYETGISAVPLSVLFLLNKNGINLNWIFGQDSDMFLHNANPTELLSKDELVNFHFSRDINVSYALKLKTEQQTGEIELICNNKKVTFSNLEKTDELHIRVKNLQISVMDK